MWTTFWPDVIVALTGALAAALLTVGIAYLGYRFESAARERQSLRGLISDIHKRRALAIDDPHVVPGAENLADYERANLSILDVRSRIRNIHDHLRPRSPAEKPLASMTAACNWYLEAAAIDPSRYWIELASLKAALYEGIKKIAEDQRRIVALEPGDGAF